MIFYIYIYILGEGAEYDYYQRGIGIILVGKRVNIWGGFLQQIKAILYKTSIQAWHGVWVLNNCFLKLFILKPNKTLSKYHSSNGYDEVKPIIFERSILHVTKLLLQKRRPTSISYNYSTVVTLRVTNRIMLK